jgi:hypothetical protein
MQTLIILPFYNYSIINSFSTFLSVYFIYIVLIFSVEAKYDKCMMYSTTSYHQENHQPVGSHRQTLSRNVVSSTPRHERVRTHNFSDDRH